MRAHFASFHCHLQATTSLNLSKINSDLYLHLFLAVCVCVCVPVVDVVWCRDLCVRIWNVDNVTLTIAGAYGGYSIGGTTGTLYMLNGAHFTFENLIIQQLWIVLLGSTPVTDASPSMNLTLDLGASIFAPV